MGGSGNEALTRDHSSEPGSWSPLLEGGYVCDAEAGNAAQIAVRCPTWAVLGVVLPRGFRAFCKRTAALYAATQAGTGHLHPRRDCRVKLYAASPGYVIAGQDILLSYLSGWLLTGVACVTDKWGTYQ